MAPVCTCDHPEETCDACRRKIDEDLTASLQDTIDAAGRARLPETAETTLGLIQARERLVAGKVQKPATLPLRSAAAARNELHTDLTAVAIEGAIEAHGPIPAPPTSTDMAAMLSAATRGALAPKPVPFKGGRPVSRRDAADHGAASLPKADADCKLRRVTLTIDVPILVGDVEDPARIVAMAVGRVRQHIPDAVLDLDAPVYIDDAGTVMPEAVATEERRIADVIFRAIDEANEECESKTEAKDQRLNDEYRQTVDEAYFDAKGGAR